MCGFIAQKHVREQVCKLLRGNVSVQGAFWLNWSNRILSKGRPGISTTWGMVKDPSWLRRIHLRRNCGRGSLAKPISRIPALQKTGHTKTNLTHWSGASIPLMFGRRSQSQYQCLAQWVFFQTLLLSNADFPNKNQPSLDDLSEIWRGSSIINA